MIHLKVRDLSETTDIEVSTFCNHDRATHQELVESAFWDAETENSIDQTALVTVCDNCNEDLMDCA